MVSFIVHFEDNVCSAHIHGFFQMKSNGIPTKVLVKDEGRAIEEVYVNNLVEHTTYAVVHASKKYMS